MLNYQILNYQPTEKGKSLTASEKYFLMHYLESDDWISESLSIQDAAKLLQADSRSTSKILNQLVDKGVMLKKANLTKKRGRPSSHFLLSPSIKENLQTSPIPEWQRKTIEYFLEVGSKAKINEKTNIQVQKEISKGKYLLLLTLALHMDPCRYITDLSKSKMAHLCGLSLSQVSLLLKDILPTLKIETISRGGSKKNIPGKFPSVYYVPIQEKTEPILKASDDFHATIPFTNKLKNHINEIKINFENFEKSAEYVRYLNLNTRILACNIFKSENLFLIKHMSGIDQNISLKIEDITNHDKELNTDFFYRLIDKYQQRILPIFGSRAITLDQRKKHSEKLLLSALELAIGIFDVLRNMKNVDEFDIRNGRYLLQTTTFRNFLVVKTHS